jgi:hypothetical protein
MPAKPLEAFPPREAFPPSSCIVHAPFWVHPTQIGEPRMSYHRSPLRWCVQTRIQHMYLFNCVGQIAGWLVYGMPGAGCSPIARTCLDVVCYSGTNVLASSWVYWVLRWLSSRYQHRVRSQESKPLGASCSDSVRGTCHSWNALPFHASTLQRRAQPRGECDCHQAWQVTSMAGTCSPFSVQREAWKRWPNCLPRRGLRGCL